MKLSHFAAFAILLAAPAAAQGPVSVPSFDSIELRGGGRVTIRHGAEQRVTLVRDEAGAAGIEVERDGKLVIRACVRTCRNQNLQVEIVTPRLDAIAIQGGGSIRTEGRFPAQSNLAVAVQGGGSIDATSIAARSVAAAVRGGGTIRTDARDSLTAGIDGGGTITYLADPRTTVAINGGGAVTRAR